MNKEEPIKTVDDLKKLDKSDFIESHKDVSSFDYKNLLNSTAIIIIFSAAAVASSTGLILIPNLETLTIFIFLVSFYYGFKIGLSMMFTTSIIYELFASIVYGFSGPLFIFKIFAYFITVLVASSIGKNLLGNYGSFKPKTFTSTKTKRFGFMATGIILTLIFDLSTTLYSYFIFQNIEAFVLFFVAGIPLMLFHELTNGIIFFFIPDYINLMNLSFTSKISVSN